MIVGKILPTVLKEIANLTPDQPNHADVFNAKLQELLDNDLTLNSEIRQYINTQISQVVTTGVPKLVSYPYSLKATANNQVDFLIPLSSFNKDTDTTLVFQNGNLLKPSDYSVILNGDGTNKISLLKGVVETTEIDLVILKNVPMGPDGSVDGNIIIPNSIPLNRLKGEVILRDEYAVHVLQEATIDAPGHAQLSNKIDGSSETKAATEKAIKDLYDKIYSMRDKAGGFAGLDDSGLLKTVSSTVRKYKVAVGNSVNIGDVVALDKDDRIVKPTKSTLPVLIDAASTKLGIPKATTTAPDGLLNTMHVANNLYCVQHRFGTTGSRFTLTFFRVLENGDVQFGPVPLIADETTDNRVFGLGISNNFSFVGVSETEAIIRYSEGNTNPFLQIIARVVIDPVTLNFSITGKTTLFSQTANYGGTGLVRISANKYMAMYAGTNALPNVVIATWNGTNFSLGTPLQVLPVNSGGLLHVVDSGRVYLTPNNSVNTKLLTITGTTISASADIVVGAGQIMQSLQLTPSLFLILLSNTNKHGIVEVMPDNSVVVREQFNLYTSGTSSTIISFDSGIVAAEDGTLVYLKEVNTNVLYALKIDTQNKKVEVASLERGAANGTTTQILRNTWAFRDSRFVIGEWTATDYRVILAYPPGETGRIVGIAKEAKSGGEDCSVVVNGVMGNLNNIVPGTFYASADGRLKAVPSSVEGSIFKGISTTEVIV